MDGEPRAENRYINHTPQKSRRFPLVPGGTMEIRLLQAQYKLQHENLLQSTSAWIIVAEFQRGVYTGGPGINISHTRVMQYAWP